MNIRILFIVLVVSLLTACCSTGTTVVLVPDANGKVGQVDVTTASGTTVLSKDKESTQVLKANQAPTKAVVISDSKIHDMFADTLAKEPTAPAHFRFYFSSGSAELMADSNEELAKTKAAIEARKSCDLSIIGHADRVGDNETNRGISIKRAETVAKALIGMGSARECMEDIRYYGENDPAIPTADNVDEPRNRRVEVEIR
jgi:outer membrane protein OmpA-like peptidoglycan-associated protein